MSSSTTHSPLPAEPSDCGSRITEGTRTRLTWLDRLLYAGTLLAVAVAVSPNLPDPDLWGHVEYARDAWRFGLPATTTYSYAAEGYPWVNHELLAETLQAWGMDTIGPIGMLVVAPSLMVMPVPARLTCITWRAKSQAGCVCFWCAAVILQEAV